MFLVAAFFGSYARFGVTPLIAVAFTGLSLLGLAIRVVQAMIVGLTADRRGLTLRRVTGSETIPWASVAGLQVNRVRYRTDAIVWLPDGQTRTCNIPGFLGDAELVRTRLLACNPTLRATPGQSPTAPVVIPPDHHEPMYVRAGSNSQVIPQSTAKSFQKIVFVAFVFVMLLVLVPFVSIMFMVSRSGDGGASPLGMWMPALLKFLPFLVVPVVSILLFRRRNR